jgi:hypothetical protein
MNVLKPAWIPLLIVVAIAIAGFTVYRARGVFGSDNEITRAGSGLANDAEPFNPKRVTYEIFGPYYCPGQTPVPESVAGQGR